MRNRLGMLLSMILLATLGLSSAPSPALAVPVSSFKVDVLHSSGRVAVSVHGKLRWLNRSVTVTDLTVNGIEGCTWSFSITGQKPRASGGWTTVDSVEDNYVTGNWVYADQTLDASDVVGGITRVEIYVIDTGHVIDESRAYGRP